MSYEIKTNNFAGPMEKLLELIEGKKMEITSISLASVTDDFLKYLEKIENEEKSFLADFILVASRLIFIKSKALLPELQLTTEEEEQTEDLERRLKIYKEFKEASKNIDNLIRDERRIFSRPLFLNRPIFFFPPAKLKSENLIYALENLLKILKEQTPKEELKRKKIVNLEEKIKEIIERISNSKILSFKSISEKKSKSEIVALFLAILHLINDKKIFINQKDNFEDIIINKN